MKILPGLLFLLIAAKGAAAAPDSKATPVICKANLKAWTASKTETLTIDQIMERMNTMFACADEAHHHHHSDKRVRIYLDEFYRVHTELANRTFDFITKHGLETQFREEENGAGNPQSASNNSDGKP
ncbi:MAG: hypothetical protein WAJ92_16295 [Candidatus Acidiferrales bacterium]